jgi:hypothetical protein
VIASQGTTLTNTPTQKEYDYYHKLYLLTRTNMPREQVKAIGSDPQYRANPELLDSMINNDTFMSFTGISF